MRFDHRTFCNEADAVSLCYTPGCVRMARHSHESNYVTVDPFTNIFVFSFISDILKATNPFLVRIPREQHEQYMTDLLTEVMKLNRRETNNNTDDGVTWFKYGLTVAFARKI